MDIDEKKKVLFVIGMEHKMESLINQKTNFKPENSLILQSYEPVISPFGDLMRDIIFAVFEENVEEIFVVAMKYEQKYPLNILNKICENKGLQEKIQTLDYLFKHSKPEFSEGNISEWLESNSGNSDARPGTSQHAKIRTFNEINPLKDSTTNASRCRA